MIFTADLEEHCKIVTEVLQILRDNKLYLKHTKCEFEQSETEYLGLIVGHQTVKMDPAKVKGITSWPVPTMRKQLRGFLGFLNFYQRFILNFAQVARPLNALTSEKKEFVWDESCQKAFEALKMAITMAPALAMPTPDGPFRVETDGSGIGLGAVLTQKQNDRWHPIAFISQSLSDAEQNYHAADLELAAVIFALQEWRHYLLDAAHPFEILTDHQNLTYFKKPQDLSRRQAQWQQLLQEYHFTFVHRPGKTNPADPLSRRSDFEKGVEDNNKAKILLPDHLFTPDSSNVVATRSVGTQKQLIHDDSSVSNSESVESIVRKLQHKREKYTTKGLTKENSQWKDKESVLLYKDLLYISKDDSPRERVIQENHDHPLAGHPGIRRTRDLILAKYYWPTIRKDIEKYVEGCDKCQKTKSVTKAAKTPLQPNAVPQCPWEIISVDIIRPLPESQGKNVILTIVDRFSKMIRVFPISTDITAKGVATIFQDHIFKLHSTPQKVISDRGPQFVSSFMDALYTLLRIQGNPSTAYHPQTDGQTERYNATIEQYLRLYTSHPQNNWVEWLALAEFAHNQNSTTTSGYSPFMLNYGQQPNIRGEHRKHVRNESAKEFVEMMQGTFKLAKEFLEHAASDMKRFYD